MISFVGRPLTRVLEKSGTLALRSVLRGIGDLEKGGTGHRLNGRLRQRTVDELRIVGIGAVSGVALVGRRSQTGQQVGRPVGLVGHAVQLIATQLRGATGPAKISRGNGNALLGVRALLRSTYTVLGLGPSNRVANLALPSTTYRDGPVLEVGLVITIKTRLQLVASPLIASEALGPTTKDAQAALNTGTDSLQSEVATGDPTVLLRHSVALARNVALEVMGLLDDDRHLTNRYRTNDGVCGHLALVVGGSRGFAPLVRLFIFTTVDDAFAGSTADPAVITSGLLTTKLPTQVLRQGAATVCVATGETGTTATITTLTFLRMYRGVLADSPVRLARTGN